MREVAIVGYQRTPTATEDHRSEAELVQAVVSGALQDAGLHLKQIGFFCSGSCDYVMGRPFSFVLALDGIAPWPPASESHVEMDGAFALYEAWVHLQMGHLDTALVYSFGKTSLCDIEAFGRANCGALRPISFCGGPTRRFQRFSQRPLRLGHFVAAAQPLSVGPQKVTEIGGRVLEPLSESRDCVSSLLGLAAQRCCTAQ